MHSRFNIYLCFAVCLLVMAKHTSVVAQQNLPFIKYEKSNLIYGSDSTPMMNFFKKIDEIKEGKRKRVNVVHYGGSHIQAGFWTEVLMDGFQSLGNFQGGGAFIFPFKIVKTNSPLFFQEYSNGKWIRKRCAINREMCENLGMAGMAAITNDSSNVFGFKLMPNNHHKNFNSVKVYHNFNPNFEFSINQQSGLNFIRKENLISGYSEFIFESFIDSIEFVLVRKDTLIKDFMLKGFSIENSNPGVYFASMGVNGASTSSFLRCNQFLQELSSIPPDLVIFSLGVNDTHDPNFSRDRFKQNYDSIIRLIREVSPDCAILFTTVTDNYINRKTGNKRPMAAREVILEYTKTHQAAVYDLYEVMGGYKSIVKWQQAGLASKDRVHFNGRGYRLFAGMMFGAIEKSYKTNSKLIQ